MDHMMPIAQANLVTMNSYANEAHDTNSRSICFHGVYNFHCNETISSSKRGEGVQMNETQVNELVFYFQF